MGWGNEIWDPEKFNPDPESWGQKSIGSRIRNTKLALKKRIQPCEY
jgi:hypothetical protein